MANPSISVGSRVRHPQYGDGLIIDNSMEAAYIVVFKHHGEKAIAKSYEDLEIIDLAPLPENRIGIGDLERILVQILRRWTDISEVVPLGNKWRGGTVTLSPADPNLKSKEIPMETFFHKIVMIRDRLRVLEQNINSNKTLSEAEKVHIQQYITRAYGSLTTFNVLFKNEADSFKGSGK